MKTNRFSLITPQSLISCLMAVLTVMATSVPLVLIGRPSLGEAVIALVLLIPVAWSAHRWGQAAGMSAALAAGLVFDFFFIPPFFTFAVGSLEGWLVLAIFMGVAIVVVGRIEASLSEARNAVFMYELSEALCGLRTQEAVSRTVAQHIQQLFQALLVIVMYEPATKSSRVVVSEPRDGRSKGRPDRAIPIMNSWGLIGEIQVWKGFFTELPPAEGRLFQNFASQAGRALERTRLVEMEESGKSANRKSISE
jgi:K+-sensing histidine kinase KdpD